MYHLYRNHNTLRLQTSVTHRVNPVGTPLNTMLTSPKVSIETLGRIMSLYQTATVT